MLPAPRLNPLAQIVVELGALGTRCEPCSLILLTQPGNVRLHLLPMVQVKRDDPIDVGQRERRELLGDMFRGRAPLPRGDDNPHWYLRVEDIILAFTLLIHAQPR